MAARVTIRPRLTALVAAFALLAATAAGPAEAAKKKRRTRRKPVPIPQVPRPHDPFAVTFTSSDGVKLHASWRPSAAGPSAPAVLLLHAFSRERRELAEVAEELGARGFATLAVDLRGHGESTSKSGARIGLSPSLQTSPSAFPRDLEAACVWLRARSPRIGVVGFSLAGNLAALATAGGCAEAGVAVSTNADPLERLAGTRPSAPRGLLVLASEKDPGRADSARRLHESGHEPKSVVLYPGAAHALDLLRSEPEAKGAAYAWLDARLGPVAPPPAPVATVPPSVEGDAGPADEEAP